MFEPLDQPRVFGLPPGVDFPAALVEGLLDRAAGMAPDDFARVCVIVNTRRMERRITQLLSGSGARLLPRILTIADLERLPGAPIPEKTVNPLQRRLELARLVAAFIQTDPSLGSPESAFDLADGLASLIDEMHGEGVSVDRILELEIGDQSGHWSRMQAFISIAADYISRTETMPDAEAARRNLVMQLSENWRAFPPDTPILVAGSTGSRGTTAALMKAVARLPLGAVVLPGFDFDLPTSVWSRMTDALASEDHPQFRFAKLMQGLDLEPDQVARWSNFQPASGTRNQLVSLALRPAPFTDAWLEEGPALGNLSQSLKNVTLIEVKSGKDEAQAIALCLKDARDQGLRAALISPDRMLTRQVAAALDRWDILPDDSAGQPLHLSPPGRFLRQLVDLFDATLRNDTLIALLKHPLTHSGGARGEHLRRTRNLELHIRSEAIHVLDQSAVESCKTLTEADSDWVCWLVTQVLSLRTVGLKSAREWTELLFDRAEKISSGAGQTAGTLWAEGAGRKAAEVLAPLKMLKPSAYQLTAREFAMVLTNLLQSDVVRDRDAPDGDIMIWGTLEARVQGADLVVLGGLNEGSWPQTPAPDPWLNRVLRDQSGLLLPERRIGLAAHDWQQAVCGPHVVLSRATRTDDAETVPSRWLNRLTNLLSGLEAGGGPAALKHMRSLGDRWIVRAKQLDSAGIGAPASRPSPRPPAEARPRKLSVTEIKRLIRDPYAIYAKHVLRLSPLQPLVPQADYLLRGTVIHGVLEDFISARTALDREIFLETARVRLESSVPWPLNRMLWMAMLENSADWFLSAERQRRTYSEPVALEARLSASLDPLDFKLTGYADRIDRRDDGAYVLIDYKTGTPPSEREQSAFDKQLLLEAAILTLFGAKELKPGPVADARFIGLGSRPKEVPAPISEHPPNEVWADLQTLIRQYLTESQGFTSRRAVRKESDKGDYDHLARYGEWDQSDPSQGSDVS